MDMYYGSSILLSSSCLCLIVNLLYIFSIDITLMLLLMSLFPLPSLLPLGIIFLESMFSSLLWQHEEDDSKTEPVI